MSNYIWAALYGFGIHAALTVDDPYLFFFNGDVSLVVRTLTVVLWVLNIARFVRDERKAIHIKGLL